jgi:hypothetical protein
MNPDTLILKHQLGQLLNALAAASGDTVAMMRNLAARLPPAEQPAALELADKHKATMNKQVAAVRTSIEAIC